MDNNPTGIELSYFKSRLKLQENGCIMWTGARGHVGHGQFKYRGKSVYAHRFSYMLNFPDFDRSLCVCHKCDNPWCVNIDHLFLGTMSENMKDKVSKGRHPVGEDAFGKLWNKDVEKILEMWKTGNYKQKYIARQFNLHQSQVSRIVNGRRWGHLVNKVGTENAIVEVASNKTQEHELMASN